MRDHCENEAILHTNRFMTVVFRNSFSKINHLRERCRLLASSLSYAHKSIVLRVRSNRGLRYLNYIKKNDFLRLWILATSRASQRKHSVSDVMKCGVIFYFVSLDSLEITHSILKDEIFWLSKMRDLLARGRNIFPAPFPFVFLGFMSLLTCN